MNKTWSCSYCCGEYQSPEIYHWQPVGWQYMAGATRWGYVKGPKRFTCSDACKKRLTIWTNWVRVTREQAVLGDVSKPARISPLTSTGIAHAIAPFGVSEDQLALC